MGSTKRTEVAVGTLYIISTVAGILNLGFLVPLLNDPDYLVGFAANESQVLVGVFLDLICAGAFVGLGLMLCIMNLVGKK